MENKISLACKTSSRLSDARSYFQCFIPAPHAAGSCSHLQLLLQGRTMPQQLLHLISYLQLLGEMSSSWGGELRLVILILTQEGMKLAHSCSKWKQEPVTCPARQSSSSWPRLMQLCYHQFPYTTRQCLCPNHPESASLWPLILGGKEYVSHLLFRPR